METMQEMQEMQEFMNEDRWTITETPFYECEDQQYKLSDFISMLTEILDQIPISHRDSATFEFNDDGDFSNIKVVYQRPETDAEFAERQKRTERYSEEQKEMLERHERAEYERLKAKYGGS